MIRPMSSKAGNIRLPFPARLLLALGVIVISACTETAAIENNAQQTPAAGTAQTGKVDSKTVDRPGTDWPIFLGPTEDGVSTEKNILKMWPEAGPNLTWQIPVGTGYSAPSVLGDRLVLHHRLAREERVECYSAATGKSMWLHKYTSDFRDPYGYNNGPRCTPLLHQNRCFTLGAEGSLRCLDLKTGELIWNRELRKDFKIPDAFFGVGATPILEGDKLIVLVGGQPNSGVVAFDSITGKTLWQNVGQDEWDGVSTGDRGRKYSWTGNEMVVSYSSPIATTIHDKRHVLCLMRHGLVSVDPNDGSVNFKYWFRSRKHESVNAARPVVVGDTILLSAAYQVGSVLLKVSPDGKGVSTVWQNSDNLLAHWSTPIYRKGHYYGFSGRHENEGEFRCIDATTGEIKWQTTGFEGDTSNLGVVGDGRQIIDRTTNKIIAWPYYGRGSCVLVGDQFIVLGERGTLALVNVSPEKWDEVCRFGPPKIHYPSWTAPVLSRGRLFLRCEDALVCYDIGR